MGSQVDHPSSGVEGPEAEAPVGRLRKRRRDESGLTTLEWLLIVAAVAGIAALAVVLVQNVVSDTSEQISGSSARLTAAKVAAAEVQREARAATGGPSEPFITSPQWKQHFTSKCERIEITYSDAGVTVIAKFDHKTGLAADKEHAPINILGGPNVKDSNSSCTIDDS